MNKLRQLLQTPSNNARAEPPARFIEHMLAKLDPLFVLVDMDAFFVQVEWQDAPHLRDTPCGVCQFTEGQNGMIIALSYEAKALGVKRFSRGDDAKRTFPSLHLFTVPMRFAKADTNKYREASEQVFDVVDAHFSRVEKASVDEGYIDVTMELKEALRRAAHDDGDADALDDSSVIYGFDSHDAFVEAIRSALFDDPRSTVAWNRMALLAAGVLVQRMRSDLVARLGYQCSAGLAPTKQLAKLCCSLNKPRRQTLLPATLVMDLLAETPLDKVRSYGGKLGQTIKERFAIDMVGELRAFSKQQLLAVIGAKQGAALYDLSRGRFDPAADPVQVGNKAQSFGSSKNLPGSSAMTTWTCVREWLTRFAQHILQRVERDRRENGRMPTLLTVSARTKSSPKLVSRCTPLYQWTEETMVESSLRLLRKILHADAAAPTESDRLSDAVTYTMISAGKMEVSHGETSGIKQFLRSRPDATAAQSGPSQQPFGFHRPLSVKRRWSEEQGTIDSLFASNQTPGASVDDEQVYEAGDSDIEILSTSERGKGENVNNERIDVPIAVDAPVDDDDDIAIVATRAPAKRHRPTVKCRAAVGRAGHSIDHYLQPHADSLQPSNASSADVTPLDGPPSNGAQRQQRAIGQFVRRWWPTEKQPKRDDQLQTRGTTESSRRH